MKTSIDKIIKITLDNLRSGDISISDFLDFIENKYDVNTKSLFREISRTIKKSNHASSDLILLIYVA